MHWSILVNGGSIHGGSPILGWFIMEHHINVDHLGILLVQETSISWFWLYPHVDFGEACGGLC